MNQAILWAAVGTLFTFGMTVLGAATVFFFCKALPRMVQRVFLGFAAGVMTAASVWGLIVPAMERAQSMNMPGYIPAVGGILLGAMFLLVLDAWMERQCRWRSSSALLMTAMTLHNIPEGMAVALSFALAARSRNPAMMAGAVALATGIGIQNFPEGAAVALPLRQEGYSVGRVFVRGCLSGVVEPIFGVAVVLMAVHVEPYMPWLLSFAAGAMLYVSIKELIPQSHAGQRAWIATMSVIAGFSLMMALDVALG